MDTRYETRILRVVSRKGKDARLILEENRFHASGGGQPGDKGRLEASGFSAEVTDCFRDGKEEILAVRILQGEPAEGVAVEAEVDLDRQALLSRMHSGEHILSRVLESRHEGLTVYKVAVGEEETTVFLKWDRQLDWPLLFEAEDEANEIIARDLPVSIRLFSPEEAQGIEGLKANWDRLGNEPVRVVTIPGFDCIACSGTHVSSTAQVGGVLVTSYRGTAPDWEVKFTVHRDRVLKEYSRVVRVLLRKVSCPLEKLEKVYDRLQEEKQVLLRSLDKAKGMLSLPWERETAGERVLSIAVLPGILPEMAVPGLTSLVESDPGSVGLVLVPSGEGSEGSFILARGTQVKIDLRKVIREHPKLMARGGGSESWVTGSTGAAVAKLWIETLQNEIA
ncbi:MAG: alanyl-tRNA editing protein [Synergistaceae bacterium]|nr:alanyl-tRNA editing protein [Synergistaceae bacterium]